MLIYVLHLSKNVALHNNVTGCVVLFQEKQSAVELVIRVITRTFQSPFADSLATDFNREFFFLRNRA